MSGGVYPPGTPCPTREELLLRCPSERCPGIEYDDDELLPVQWEGEAISHLGATDYLPPCPSCGEDGVPADE